MFGHLFLCNEVTRVWFKIVSYMDASAQLQKDVVIDPHHPATPSWSSYFNPISPLKDAFERIVQFKADLGLPHPGTVENIQKEVKGSRLHFGFRKTYQPPFSDTSNQLHVRWRSGRLDQESFSKPTLPSHAFLRFGFANPSFIL